MFAFLRKNFKVRSYLKIIGVARRMAQGARAPSIEMPQLTKIRQKSIVFSFSI